MKSIRWWQALGLAGLAGMAAGGAVIARRERVRRSYTPDQIRDRLQQRYAEIGAEAREEATADWRARRSGR